MKKAFLVGLLALLLFATVHPAHAQESITLSDQNVVYELPYPGILPDHPLYIFKSIRDHIIEFTTRETMRKAEFLLAQSDKFISMAPPLEKKGKDKLAAETAQQAEEAAARIPDLVKTSKSQGVGPSSEFITKLKGSNAKHREVLESLLRDIPQGEREAVTHTLDLNKQSAKALESLKP